MQFGHWFVHLACEEKLTQPGESMYENNKQLFKTPFDPCLSEIKRFVFNLFHFKTFVYCGYYLKIKDSLTHQPSAQTQKH